MRKIVLLGLAMVMLLSLSVSATAQTCYFISTRADGSVLGPYSVSSASDNPTVTWITKPGRSYSIDVTTYRGPSGSGSWGEDVNLDNTFCPTTDETTGLTVTARDDGLSGTYRRSIQIADTGGPTFLELRVGNTSASSSQVRITVSETTMFNPAWSTFGSFNTFYSLQNTTSFTCNATLTLRDTTGTVQTTSTFPITAGATASTNTSALATARNLSGTGTVSHDCPPGGLLGEAAIADFTKADPYVQFVQLKPTREALH